MGDKVIRVELHLALEDKLKPSYSGWHRTTELLTVASLTDCASKQACS